MSKLWDSVRQGDRDSYIELYETYYQKLYIYGFKISRNKPLLKDCIQDMFIEIWRKRDKLKEVKSLEPYLLTYLRRKLYKELKHSDHIKSDDYIPEEEDMSYEDMLIRNESLDEKKEKLKSELENLTPRQKEIIKMLYYEGLSHDEIAEYTSSTKRTVYNHIHQAFETLKKGLKIIPLLPIRELFQ